MILTDYACVPPCKACRESEECANISQAIALDYYPERVEWQPNMEPDVLLTCGCTIPWPIVALLGSNGKQVNCDLHGWKGVSQSKITEMQRTLKRLLPGYKMQKLPDVPQF